MYIIHHNQLTKIGWIGEYFLITGHPCVETNFTGGGTKFTYGFTIKNGAIGQ